MVEAVEDLKIWMGNLLILSKYGGGTLPLLPPISTGSAGGGGNHQGRQADSDFSSLQDNLGDNLWFSDISVSSLIAL